LFHGFNNYNNVFALEVQTHASATPFAMIIQCFNNKSSVGGNPSCFRQKKKKTAFNLLWTPSPVLLSLGWQEHRNNLFRREQGASWDKPTKEERRSLGVLHCMSGLLTRWPRFADAKAWTKYQRIDRAKADVREQITGGEARLWLECNEMDRDAAPSVGICLASGVGVGNI